jgi:glutaredoxin-related protein
MVKFEERDVFMSVVNQQEVRDRMQMDHIDVPQLFVDGQYIGVC